MDINDQIAENLGLVYQQLRRFKLLDDPDAESFAYEALYKAVLTYDESTGYAFSTYAVCIIANALRKHLRTLNKKRQLHVISYEEPLDRHTDEGHLVDVLVHAEDTESQIMRNELHEVSMEAFDEILETLSDRHRLIITKWYESEFKLTQTEIAKALGISQATVSKALSAFKHKLKVRLEEYL